ncbi:hypothetical protein [Bdellovibrio sp. NC01]|uniref:hypothetical protein n=1 Tax=Bdellovibrio sp. NC01 TaxID=2220073 RepID=UPI001159E589|nr:hypothetical protein [Bdellovibrio sp. NC01]QDK37912.1 hypothetical protein DOE51_10115 [Bdellovibrio sp. NC01]
MIKLIYKSKLMREEIKHWIALISLGVCALLSIAWGLSKKEKIIVIGMDEAGTRLIANQSDRLIQNELKVFFKNFFELYYGYNDVNYNERMRLATDLFSEELWQEEREKITQIGANLKKTPLSQSVEILSIDRVDNFKIEAILLLKIKARMNDQQVKLKVNIEYRKTERTEANAYGYEITSITDAAI